MTENERVDFPVVNFPVIDVGLCVSILGKRGTHFRTVENNSSNLLVPQSRPISDVAFAILEQVQCRTIVPIVHILRLHRKAQSSALLLCSGDCLCWTSTRRLTSEQLRTTVLHSFYPHSSPENQSILNSKTCKRP